MNDETVYAALIADMDGVLTQTAALHERAWKQTFDAFLCERGDPRPFSSEDYRAHVDGKPRYEGAAAFLEARGIELSRGQPSDPPGAATICGLGNRKNELFLELLEREGAEIFDDAVAAIARWRRGELPVAVVSASRNCRRVLASVGLDAQVDAIVDGETRDELELDGKHGLLLEAARRLQVEPARAVVLEDSSFGIEAARAAEFGLAVGVDRKAQAQALQAAGADEVVSDLFGLRFVRRVPSALARREQITAWLRDREPALFLDYDGTLTPIVDDPADAVLPAAMRATLESLAARWPVAVVSGRQREDVEERVAVGNIVYAGDHGFDIAGRGQQNALPEAEAALPEVERAEQLLRARLADIPGAIVERKRFCVAAHYRKVATREQVSAVLEAVDAAREATGLRERSGKKVVELQPPVAWDKGHAVNWIRSVLGLDPQTSSIIYIGDDETDEDAFASLRGDGLGIRVGPEVSSTLADYRLADPDAVLELLDWLSERAAAREP